MIRHLFVLTTLCLSLYLPAALTAQTATEKAEAFFDRYQELYQDHDPAWLELFAEDAPMTLAQFHRQSGQSRLLEGTVARFHRLLIAELQQNQTEGDPSIFVDVFYEEAEDGSVWITSTRVSGQDGARFPVRFRVAGGAEGTLEIVEWRAAAPVRGGALEEDIERWAVEGSDASVQALVRLWRGPDGDASQLAARALIEVAERDLEATRRERAGQIGLELYLSGANPGLRRRALAAYVRGVGEEALPRLESILEGQVDADFRPLAVELLAGVRGAAAREVQQRFGLVVEAVEALRDGHLVSWLTYELPSFWALDPESRQNVERQIGRQRYEQIHTDDVFVMRKARYLSDGLKVVAYVYGPVQPLKPRPVVIFARSGFVAGDEAPSLLPIFHRLASAGFQVVAPQYRGSDGGEGEDEVGGADVAEVHNAIVMAQDLPAVDPKNVFLYGMGRGGMMVLQALRDGAPVRAAAVVGAPTDLGAALAAGSPVWREELWPDFAARRESILEARSALGWVDRIQVPLLLFHGGADTRVSPVHSLRLAQELESLGRLYELRILGDGDGFLDRPYQRREPAVIHWFRQALIKE